jgi:hypothetical protein
MRHSPHAAGAVLLLAVLVAPVTRAQDSTNVRDTSAVNALERMGKYLRSLDAFQVHGDITTEEVQENGQKIQYATAADLLANKPNKLFVEIKNERAPRLLYYDGSNFTMYAPRLNFYATVDAPPTVRELVDKLDDKFDIQMPLVDLFRWGTPEGDTKEITGALTVGDAVINGVTCTQYAFRQEGLDWQLWIQEGEFPLPLRVVLTTTTDDARPQHTSAYTWNLAPSFNDKAFAFEAPKEAKKITMMEFGTAVPTRPGGGQ